jgi:hypothetical protein
MGECLVLAHIEHPAYCMIVGSSLREHRSKNHGVLLGVADVLWRCCRIGSKTSCHMKRRTSVVVEWKPART